MGLQSIEVSPSSLAGVLYESLKKYSKIGLYKPVRVLFAALSHNFEETLKLFFILTERIRDYL